MVLTTIQPIRVQVCGNFLSHDIAHFFLYAISIQPSCATLIQPSSAKSIGFILSHGITHIRLYNLNLQLTYALYTRTVNLKASSHLGTHLGTLYAYQSKDTRPIPYVSCLLSICRSIYTIGIGLVSLVWYA